MAKKTLAENDKLIVEGQQPLSKNQKSFNALVEKINERRARLAEWNAYLDEFNRRYNRDFVPQRRRLDEVRAQLVVRLDQAHDSKGLTKGERATIAELITLIGGQVLDWADDPRVGEIHARYKASDARSEAGAKARVEDVVAEASTFGTPPETDMDSPEALMQRIQEQLDLQEKAEQDRRHAREGERATRRKKARASAAEERARVEEADVHQSIRDIYRKLASTLHPDREADPIERERKAALMQRVNRAYAGRSLLDLLEIQLELEHIDRAALERVSAVRLKRWNTVLNDQLEGLDREIAEVGAELQMRCGMTPGGPTSPKIIKRALSDAIRDLGEHIRWFENDLRVFDDIERLKPWLAAMKTNLRAVE